MIFSRISISVSICVFLSCVDQPTNPPLELPPLEELQLLVKQTGYYEYMVLPTSPLTSPSRIDRIELWGRADTTYWGSPAIDSLQTTMFPASLGQKDQYEVYFVLSGSFVRSRSTEETIQLKFYGESDVLLFSIDTTVSTFKYPYPNAEIVLANPIYTENLQLSGSDFQTMTFIGDTLFYVTSGATRLFRYNKESATTTLLLDYGGGDHVASDSGYLFIDYGHSRVLRWNVTAGTEDGFIIDLSNPRQYIFGMDAIQGQLILIAGPSSSQPYMIRFDYSGNIINSTPFQFNGHYLAIHDSILHTRNNNIHEIVRYTFGLEQLPSFVAPVSIMDGTKFHDGYMYFGDYHRTALGRVPIGDLILKE